MLAAASTTKKYSGTNLLDGLLRAVRHRKGGLHDRDLHVCDHDDHLQRCRNQGSASNRGFSWAYDLIWLSESRARPAEAYASDAHTSTFSRIIAGDDPRDGDRHLWVGLPITDRPILAGCAPSTAFDRATSWPAPIRHDVALDRAGAVRRSLRTALHLMATCLSTVAGRPSALRSRPAAGYRLSWSSVRAPATPVGCDGEMTVSASIGSAACRS